MAFCAFGENLLYHLTYFKVESPWIKYGNIFEFGEAKARIDIIVFDQSFDSINFRQLIAIIIDDVKYLRYLLFWFDRFYDILI